ncbi:MAG: hypothetical protein LKM39_11535 [Chiayiivirga sp.]|nr:hypothetical protein [Chiayiivirga sp.]
MPGGATCWGNNVFGQLGDGSRALRRAPVSVSGLDSGVVAVSTGANHSCALTIGGGVKCWGANFQNQLGNGTTSQSLVPIDVSGLTAGVQAIDIGISHTCALTTGGGVKCWGLNSSGQLGDGSSTNRAVPTDVSGLTSGVVAISAGDRHTCALTMAGGVKCWGNNQYGQLGDGTTTASLVPVDVPSLTSGVAAISAGAGQGHTCALTLGGSVKCWGYNGYGNLGDGSYTNRSTPVDVSGLTGIAAISAGYYLTCAVTTDGAMKCWGNNNYGKLGNGGLAISNQPTPADVPGFGGAVAAISAGREHTCAVTTSGVAKCWGWAQFGQLGIDDRNYGLPDHVLGLGPAIFQSGFELGQ